jgi:hypothetical protein
LKICNKNAGGKDLHFRSIETIWYLFWLFI